MNVLGFEVLARGRIRALKHNGLGAWCVSVRKTIVVPARVTYARTVAWVVIVDVSGKVLPCADKKHRQGRNEDECCDGVCLTN